MFPNFIISGQLTERDIRQYLLVLHALVPTLQDTMRQRHSDVIDSDDDDSDDDMMIDVSENCVVTKLYSMTQANIAELLRCTFMTS